MFVPATQPAIPLDATASSACAAAAGSPARAERDRRLAALMAEVVQGSSSAFEAFYDATSDYAHALARRMVRDSEIDDLLADAYFEAWRTAPRFDPSRGSAVTWLLTIVRSRALDLLRHRAAYPSQAGEQVPEVAGDEASGPAERLWLREAGSRLDLALRELSSAERWVLGLAYFRDLTHAAIAAETGMPLGTVKSLILRAQTKLRTQLAE